jgi:hypothetical protein
MIIMDQPILSIIVFSIVMGLVVFIYDLIVPGLTGKQRAAMTIMDLVLLTIFFAIVIFVLRAIGFWPTLVAGI